MLQVLMRSVFVSVSVEGARAGRGCSRILLSDNLNGMNVLSVVRSDQKRHCVLSKIQIVLKSSRTDVSNGQNRGPG